MLPTNQTVKLHNLRFDDGFICKTNEFTIKGPNKYQGMKQL